MRTTALILALMLTVAIATESHPLTNSQMKQLQHLLQEKKWASIVLGLAELHLMAQGPIESLIEAINDVVDDLHEKLEQAQTEFDERTN
jgi:hypothetical protein